MSNRVTGILFFVALISFVTGCSDEKIDAAKVKKEHTSVVAAEADITTQNSSGSYAEGLYQQKCAMCHDGSMAEAPTREAIESNTAAALYATLTTGVMSAQAQSISNFDKELLANYLASSTTDTERRNADVNFCPGELEFAGGEGWTRWGGDVHNTRYQPTEKSGINAQNIDQLELKWAFGMPGAVRARSQPAVTKEALYTGSQDGTVYALDPETGCVWWRFFADAEVRNAPVIDYDESGVPQTVYFGDFNANVYAVNAQTGEEVWRISVQDHPVTTLTGSFAHHDSVLFVPLSSTEVVSAFNPDYECCTFRGGVIAIDMKTGKRLWRFFTVPEPLKTGENENGYPSWGPSGAPVWTTPTVDPERGLLYFGTGENYSSPASELSDAIVAVTLDKGELVWAQQTISGDAWNGACIRDGINCPKEDGPDFDFGAPALLVTGDDGSDVIIAGQKSGMVFGLDADDGGKVLWSKRAGMGGYNGGIHWGMASDGEVVYVGVADTPGHHLTTGPARQGVHTYRVRTGEEVWSIVEEPFCEGKERRCQTAISAAVTATKDIVFAGALNGLLNAYSAENGELLWRYDTNISFETVNGVEAKGGSIDATGPVVIDGMVFVNSGYDKFGNISGNVLLAFGIVE